MMLLSSVLATAPAAGQTTAAAPVRLLVQPKAGVTASDLRALFGRHRLGRLKRIRHINVHVLRVAPNELAAAEAALRADPRVQFVERDRAIPPALAPNDPNFPVQYHLDRVACPAAWEASTGAAGVPIAILDSGVDASHPDLAAKLVPGFNTFDNNTDTRDVYGHGTKVAGVAAALGNNGIGVAGIAWANPLMPIRVTDLNGSAYISTLASGLVWAADHGARIANVSFAVYGAHALNSAAQYFASKGGVVFAAAGNDSFVHTDVANPWVISVGATDASDRLASFSSTGPYVDLSAPGIDITTTVMGGGYGPVSGTSFSSPIAAGVAGLVFGANAALSPTQVGDLLSANAEDFGPLGYDAGYGWGRVNAANAVAAARTIPTGADTTAPVVAISSPRAGETVGGMVTVRVDARDDRAVARVVLFADSRMIGTMATAPYQFVWNTRAVRPGNHTLRAKAYDAAGNVTLSSPVVVTLADFRAPAVRLTAPVNGGSYPASAMLTLNALANDAGGVVRVDFAIDNTSVLSVARSPYRGQVALAGLMRGTHTVIARAVDAAGNVGASQAVRFTVR
jgi:subtilisin family serine protease